MISNLLKFIPDKLYSFKAPYLEEKLLLDHVFDSTKRYDNAFESFKTQVAITTGDTLSVPNQDANKLWQQFILFTKEYHAFCHEFNGVYLHHTPKKRTTTTITDCSEIIAPHFIQNLSQTKMKYFTDLSEYDLPALRASLVDDNLFDDESCKNAFVEFKKYIGIFKLHAQPMVMTSNSVDQVWHRFILLTKDYHNFCNSFVGKYFHHKPFLPSRPGAIGGEEKFFDLYRSTYGDVPQIWHK